MAVDWTRFSLAKREGKLLALALVLVISTLAVTMTTSLVADSSTAIIHSPTTQDMDDEMHQKADAAILAMPLYERLKEQFPYSVSSKPLDKNVLQTGPPNLKNNLNKDMLTWYNITGFKYTFLTDDDCIKFVWHEYGQYFPEIIEAFQNMPRKILQYDFFRYLGLFIMGGTYTDTDTIQSKPFEEWITYNETLFGEVNKVGAVVGLENECDCLKWQGIVSRRMQFCQWTFQAKRHHPFLAYLISGIVDKYQKNYNKKEKYFVFEGQKYDFKKGSEGYYDGTMMFVGPGRFTDAVFGYINAMDPNKTNLINPNNQTKAWESIKHKNLTDKTWTAGYDGVWFGWQNITKMTEPVLVDDDLLLLPDFYFKGSKEKNPANLVNHKYHGSWKGANND